MLPVWAANDEKDKKEADRVKDAGQVLKEILNIPDDIPPDLLDRAECIVVLPSVKKAAIGIGGSYGRGVMISTSEITPSPSAIRRAAAALSVATCRRPLGPRSAR